MCSFYFPLDKVGKKGKKPPPKFCVAPRYTLLTQHKKVLWSMLCACTFFVVHSFLYCFRLPFSEHFFALRVCVCVDDGRNMNEMEALVAKV